jgi:ADP-ribose pyrophosphatase YjhB (NUDIX family)
LNPLPVSVVLVPVDGGVLTVRRSIEPCKGQLALPGGYINADEAWQTAGAREVWEETGLKIAPDEIREFRVRSAPDGTVLIFGIARSRAIAELPRFVPNDEVSELVVLREPQPLAFPLHTQVVEEFFNPTLAHR